MKKVAECAIQCFIANEKPNVMGIVLAGSAEFKSELATSELLDHRLQGRIIKLIDVSYGGENGFNQAIELATDALANVKFVKEKKLITSLFEEVAQDSNKIVYSVKDTLTAMEMGAVETLILWENLDDMRYEVRNPVTGQEQVLTLTRLQCTDNKYFVDEANNCDLEIVNEQALTEWLVENYHSYGSVLEFVTDRS